MAQTTPESLIIPTARMSDAPTIMRRTLKAEISTALAAYGRTDALPTTKYDRFNLLRDIMIAEGDHTVAGAAPATTLQAPTPPPGQPAAVHTLAAVATAPAGPGGTVQNGSVARLVHVVESLLASRHVPGPGPRRPDAAVVATAPLLPGQGAPAPGEPTARQRLPMEIQAQIQAELGATVTPGGYAPTQGGAGSAGGAAAAPRDELDSFFAPLPLGYPIPVAPAQPAAPFPQFSFGGGPGYPGLGIGTGFGGSRFGMGGPILNNLTGTPVLGGAGVGLGGNAVRLCLPQ